MASASLSRRPVAVAAVLVLVLWPLQIERLFGLPAHPLIIHVPVVFIPILGVAALALALAPRERFLLPVAVFSVVTLAVTLLAAGAGEAFQEVREDKIPADMKDVLQNHEDAGGALRLTMVLLTLLLVAWPFSRRGWLSVVLRVLVGLLALTAVFFVIRTGHLGAELAWGE
jgi:uncharacterized membrane protein